MSNILIGSVPFNSGFSNGFQINPLGISFIEISAQPADISSSAIISVEEATISVSQLIKDLIVDVKQSVDNKNIEIINYNPDIISGSSVNVEVSDFNINLYNPDIISGSSVNVEVSDFNINLYNPNIISTSNQIINTNLTDIILTNNQVLVNTDQIFDVDYSDVLINHLKASLSFNDIINVNLSQVDIIMFNASINVSVNIIPLTSYIDINNIDPYVIHECLNIDNPFFDMDSDCKQKEGLLYDNLLVGAINQIGVDSNWYVTDYSTNNEKTFGEDNDRLIKRKFYIKYMTDELPKDERLFDGHGISGMDVFHIYIPKQSFAQMSQLNESKQIAYQSYKPQPGDIIQSLHNNVFYEVIEVKDKIELFLQRTHSWDITLRPNINKHYNVSLNLITDPINDAIPDEDILSQNDLINNIKSDVLFDDMQNFNPFNL